MILELYYWYLIKIMILELCSVNGGSLLDILRAWNDPEVEDWQAQSWSLSSHGKHFGMLILLNEETLSDVDFIKWRKTFGCWF